MKSIKVSFDYEGKHYGFNAKFKYEKSGIELTAHKCNGDITINSEDDDWIVYNHDNGVEVKVDNQMDNILNVILWDSNPDGPALAMLGEFDNYKGEIEGLW